MASKSALVKVRGVPWLSVHVPVRAMRIHGLAWGAASCAVSGVGMLTPYAWRVTEKVEMSWRRTLNALSEQGS